MWTGRHDFEEFKKRKDTSNAQKLIYYRNEHLKFHFRRTTQCIRVLFLLGWLRVAQFVSKTRVSFRKGGMQTRVLGSVLFIIPAAKLKPHTAENLPLPLSNQQSGDHHANARLWALMFTFGHSIVHGISPSHFLTSIQIKRPRIRVQSTNFSTHYR